MAFLVFWELLGGILSGICKPGCYAHTFVTIKSFMSVVEIWETWTRMKLIGWGVRALPAFQNTSVQEKSYQTLFFVFNRKWTQQAVPLEVPVAFLPNCKWEHIHLQPHFASWLTYACMHICRFVRKSVGLNITILL